MTDEPREETSEITETPVLDGLGHFLLALVLAIVTGTLVLIVGTLFIENSNLDLEEFAEDMLLFFVFASFFALMGMLIICLPVTFVLRALQSEYATFYAALGAVAGFLFLSENLKDYTTVNLEDLLIPVSAGLAGLASGLHWGHWRERCAEARRLNSQQRPTDKRDNPIHDLTH